MSRPPYAPGRRWLTSDYVIESGRHELRATPLAGIEDNADKADTVASSPHLELECIRLNAGEAAARMRAAGNHECWLHQNPAEWIVRNPRPGDRMDVLGLKGSKLISDIMKDAGLDPWQKRSLPLILDAEGRPLWLPGIRRSRHHLIPDGHEGIFYRISLRQ